jgi:hypothetical protein
VGLAWKLSVWVVSGEQLLFLEKYLGALQSVNTEVTNALRKNIFIFSRHYKNVLLRFNHELTHSNQLTNNA